MLGRITRHKATRTKPLARWEASFRELSADRAGLSFGGPQEERVMFEDLAKGIERDYKLRGLRSMRAAKGRMVHLKKAFGDVRALDITPDRVRDYQAHRRAEDASPATVNRETSHLARAFRIAVKSGLLTIVPPFPNRLEESAPRQGFFEHAEYLAVREHLTPAVYLDVLDFAYYSGWRRGEITGLTWREIDMAGGVIRLDPERSKTKTGRVLPLSVPLKEALQRRIATRRLDSLLVFHRDGEPMIDWRKAWAAACKLAKLPGKRLHDCRRTVARNLVRSGTPERVAMQLTGLRPVVHLRATGHPSSGLPTVAHGELTKARLRQGYGGQTAVHLRASRYGGQPSSWLANRSSRSRWQA